MRFPHLCSTVADVPRLCPDSSSFFEASYEATAEDLDSEKLKMLPVKFDHEFCASFLRLLYGARCVFAHGSAAPSLNRLSGFSMGGAISPERSTTRSVERCSRIVDEFDGLLNELRTNALGARVTLVVLTNSLLFLDQSMHMLTSGAEEFVHAVLGGGSGDGVGGGEASSSCAP